MKEQTPGDLCRVEVEKINDERVRMLAIGVFDELIRGHYRGNMADDRESPYPISEINKSDLQKFKQFSAVINLGNAEDYDYVLSRAAEGSPAFLVFNNAGVKGEVKQLLKARQQSQPKEEQPVAPVVKVTKDTEKVDVVTIRATQDIEKVDVDVKPAAVAAKGVSHDGSEEDLSVYLKVIEEMEKKEAAQKQTPPKEVQPIVKPAAVAASTTDSAKSEQDKYLDELRAIVLPKRKELEAEQQVLNDKCAMVFIGKGKINNPGVADVVHQRFNAILKDKDAPKPTQDDITKIVEFAQIINKPKNAKEYMKALKALDSGSFSERLFGDDAVKKAVKEPPKPEAKMEMSTEMADKAEKAARKEAGKKALESNLGSYDELVRKVTSVAPKEDPNKGKGEKSGFFSRFRK